MTYTFHIVDAFSLAPFGGYQLVSVMGRRSETEAKARKSGDVVTSVSVGGATTYVASGEIAYRRPPLSRKAPS